MMDVVGGEWALAALGAVLVGVAKTGVPGVGILTVPLFAAIMPAKASTGVVLPMLIVADLFAVAAYRQHAVWRHLWGLFPWTALGVLLGYLLLGRVSDAQLRPVIGVIVLVMLALNAWRTSRPESATRIPTHPAFAALFGVAAGATTMMANAAGPVMMIYLLAMRLPKNEFIGTGAWYFALLNLFKVPFSANLGLINAESLRFNLVLIPAIATGALLGFVLARHIPQKAFNRLVQLFALLGALRLLF